MNKRNKIKIEISDALEYITRDRGAPPGEKLARATNALTRCYQFLLDEEDEEDKIRIPAEWDDLD